MLGSAADDQFGTFYATWWVCVICQQRSTTKFFVQWSVIITTVDRQETFQCNSTLIMLKFSFFGRTNENHTFQKTETQRIIGSVGYVVSSVDCRYVSEWQNRQRNILQAYIHSVGGSPWTSRRSRPETHITAWRVGCSGYTQNKATTDGFKNLPNFWKLRLVQLLSTTCAEPP